MATVEARAAVSAAEDQEGSRRVEPGDERRESGAEAELGAEREADSSLAFNLLT